MKIIIDSNILVEDKYLTRDMKTLIMKAYIFKETNTFNPNKNQNNTKYEPKTRKTFSRITKDGIVFYAFPPNFVYFKSNILDKFPDLEYTIIDSRVCPTFDYHKTNIIPRDNQQDIIKSLEDVGYNAIVSAATSFGKTTMSLYLTEYLKTNMLFIASRISLIENLKKDIKQFNINQDDICEINSKWLENPVIKPIMYCTIQALNDNILAYLYNKIGMLVADEVHLGIGGKENIERLFSLNPKYRLYLSATYKNQNFVGLNEALLSSNIITSEEVIQYKIDIETIYVNRESKFHTKYTSKHTAHEKKEILYDKSNLEQISQLAYYKVKKECRGVLIYVEAREAQNELTNILSWFGLKVGLLNSDTKKSLNGEILNNFDNGEYDIIIAGNSISAGVSLYRLSTIINLNITTNENNLVQIIGRLKRYNPEICDKTKEYIQVSILGLSSKKWEKDIQCLKKFDYLNFKKILKINMAESFEDFIILREYRKWKKGDK